MAESFCEPMGELEELEAHGVLWIECGDDMLGALLAQCQCGRATTCTFKRHQLEYTGARYCVQTGRVTCPWCLPRLSPGRRGRGCFAVAGLAELCWTATPVKVKDAIPPDVETIPAFENVAAQAEGFPLTTTAAVAEHLDQALAVIVEMRTEIASLKRSRDELEASDGRLEHSRLCAKVLDARTDIIQQNMDILHGAVWGLVRANLRRLEPAASPDSSSVVEEATDEDDNTEEWDPRSSEWNPSDDQSAGAQASDAANNVRTPAPSGGPPQAAGPDI